MRGAIKLDREATRRDEEIGKSKEAGAGALGLGASDEREMPRLRCLVKYRSRNLELRSDRDTEGSWSEKHVDSAKRPLSLGSVFGGPVQRVEHQLDAV